MKNTYKYMEADKGPTNIEYKSCISFGADNRVLQQYTSYFNTAVTNGEQQLAVLRGHLNSPNTIFNTLEEIKNKVSKGEISPPWQIYQITPSIISLSPSTSIKSTVTVTQNPIDTNTGAVLKSNPATTLNIKTLVEPKITPNNVSSVLTNFVFCAFGKTNSAAGDTTYSLACCVPIVYNFGIDNKTNTGYFKLGLPNEVEYYKNVLFDDMFKNPDFERIYNEGFLVHLSKTSKANQVLSVPVKSENNKKENTTETSNNNEKETDTPSKVAIDTNVNPISKDWSVAQKTMADNFIQSTFKNIASGLTSTDNAKEFVVTASDNNTYAISLENNNAKINFKLIERLTVRSPKLKLQEGSVLFDGARAISNKALASINDKSLGKDTLKYILELDNVVIQKVVNTEDNGKNLVHKLPNNTTFLRDVATALAEQFKVGFDKELQASEFTYGNYSFRVQVNFSEKEIKCTPVDAKKGIYDISIPVEVVKTDIKERTLSKVKGVLTPAAAVAGGILAGVGSLAKGGNSYYRGTGSLN